jgi:hypothetical protein
VMWCHVPERAFWSRAHHLRMIPAWDQITEAQVMEQRHVLEWRKVVS